MLLAIVMSNAIFSTKRKDSAFIEVRQYFNLVFKVNTKHKLLATGLTTKNRTFFLRPMLHISIY